MRLPSKVTASVLACLTFVSGQTLPSNYVISTIAGTNFSGDGLKATEAPLASVEALTVDSSGNLYIADTEDHRVRRVSASGIITTVVGNGAFGVRGDGGLATDAQLNKPYGLALDDTGNLYVADLGNQRIRRVNPDRTITTIVGSGEIKPPGEGGEAAAAKLQAPRNVAVDTAGNLFISDFGDHRVYRVTPAGQIDIVAGTGDAGFTESGDALSVKLNAPTGLAVDRLGALYIGDSGNRAVRRLFNGKISTILGGSERSVPLDAPTALAVDYDGNLYVTDNSRLYKRTPAGQVTSLAVGARAVAVSLTGTVFYAMGAYVYRLVADGKPVVYAGNGTFGVLRENVDAGLAYLQGPTGVAYDDFANLYIAEQLGKRVRRVNSQGMISTFAGGGTATPGDAGPAILARLFDPVAVAFDAIGGFRVADSLGSRVRGVDSAGVISTAAGDGEYGFGGENGPGYQSRLNKPGGVLFDRQGNLYIADTYNNRVRRIGLDGVIATIAGSGIRGYYGDGGAARQAQLSLPTGLALDVLGNLYVSDTGNNVVRKVTTGGVISTVAGSGVKGFGGDGGPAILAALNGPNGIVVDSLRTLYIADRLNHRIRRVAPDGVITTIAGDGLPGFYGDGASSKLARLNGPVGIALDSKGNLVIADTDNNRIRRLVPAPDDVLPPGSSNEATTIVMNAASMRTSPVAPGAIVSIFAPGIGPGSPTAAKVEGGKVSAELNQTQVRFDGVPAPLLYASADQINCQVPYTVGNKDTTTIEVYRAGILRTKATVPVAASAPALFTLQNGVGQVLAYNEDGTPNSADTPANRGSVVTILGTGEGQTWPNGQEGVAATDPLPTPLLPVEVTIGGVKAEIIFAGSAPGAVGIFQLNVRLPGLFTPPGQRAVVVTVGGVSSQPGVTISVQ